MNINTIEERKELWYRVKLEAWLGKHILWEGDVEGVGGVGEHESSTGQEHSDHRAEAWDLTLVADSAQPPPQGIQEVKP